MNSVNFISIVPLIRTPSIIIAPPLHELRQLQSPPYMNSVNYMSITPLTHTPPNYIWIACSHKLDQTTCQSSTLTRTPSITYPTAPYMSTIQSVKLCLVHFNHPLTWTKPNHSHLYELNLHILSNLITLLLNFIQLQHTTEIQLPPSIPLHKLRPAIVSNF